MYRRELAQVLRVGEHVDEEQDARLLVGPALLLLFWPPITLSTLRHASSVMTFDAS